jgi:hypothetical protein
LGKPVLKASFVRTVGERDRIYVVRSDGSEVNWTFPTYGDALPHDLIHLVVEAAFGLGQGFWGRVDAGVDPGAIMADANRRGGSNKFSGFGTAMSELQLAEALANPGWLVEEPSTASLHERILVVCRESGLSVPDLLSAERIDQVRVVLKSLASRWRRLTPKGTVTVAFDSEDASRAFDQLWKEEAVEQTAEHPQPSLSQRSNPKRSRLRML